MRQPLTQDRPLPTPTPDPNRQSQRRGGLTRRTLINMTLRVAGVMLVSVGVSYIHVMYSLETQTQQQLNKYILERGQRESTVFKLAEDNLTFLREQILAKLQQPSNDPFASRFDRLHYAWSDGSLRNAPQDQPSAAFDTAQYPTTLIPKNVKPDAAHKRLFMTAYDLIQAYGPAWSVRFPNLYFNTTAGTSAVYWKGQPANLLAPGDMNLTQQEFFYVADPAHNPQRQPAWTGVYLDPYIKAWMVSAIVPIDDASGKFIGTVGHDIILTDLIKQTVENQLPGTYNLIFRPDGHLIVHPKLMDKIQKAEGNLTIVQTGDAHLQRIFQQVQNSTTKTAVIENSQDQEYLAFTQLSTTGWYFVTVHPKSLLWDHAFDTVKFFLIAGIIALLVEILLLFSVLKQQVTNPLKRLIAATNRLATGDFQLQLDTTRKDELGELATSFTSMAHQLKHSFQQLGEINVELEQRVDDRTRELQKALTDLQLNQLQMVQSAKMSSLGQMVAGVAHEINNPVNFIHGNLGYVRDYSDHLMQLIQSYQQSSLLAGAAADVEVNQIELEFIQADLPKLLSSMEVGTERIREIVLSLRNFSRLDEAELKAVDIHEGIDSTLLILQHRLKNNPQRPAIEVVKDYGNLPVVNCYSGQLNQVFMNILTNAIDALEEIWNKTTKQWERQGSQLTPMQTPITAGSHYSDTPNPEIFVPCITIRTTLIEPKLIEIMIADNGVGIPEAVQACIFDPFFTTKSIGKGTGMGMSISYQIIVEKHQGQLKCLSTHGQGTAFMIQIPILQLTQIDD
jgi:two-component system, NtrC family, sensor kinase